MPSSPSVTMDCLVSEVSDCPVNMCPACKLDSSSVCSDCLVSNSPSTSALEMNIFSTYVPLSSCVQTAPHVAVQQVMNSDAALNSVIVPETKSNKSHFHISCHLKGRHRTIRVAAMVDSGATSLFIDHKFAKQHRMLQQLLEQPITLYNIDGSKNEAGSITHKVSLLLKVGQDEEKFDFYVTSLGPEKVILGLPWLRHRNPQINWHEGTLQLNADQGMGPEPFEVEVTKIAANRMERRRLLAEKVLTTSQDEVLRSYGLTASPGPLGRLGVPMITCCRLGGNNVTL